ncbi:hypothetical protein SPBRAN_1655 [uncultured Candidatus Thioglobus sp.]|nr:hypothetical protein SPBRAN_1655 [uncultured Candidatus Thioglobus sp.]
MKKYLILFALLFTFFVLNTLPISLFNSTIQRSNLDISALKGSVWQGSAYSSKLGAIDWDFSPLKLLQAKLSWTIGVKQTTNHALSFEVAVDIFKQLHLSEVNGFLSDKTLKNLSLLPDNVANIALFELQIKQLDLILAMDKANAKPHITQGHIQVKKLNILGQQLGQYQLLIHSKNQQLNAVITDKNNSPIKTHLTAHLSKTGALNIQGNIKANNPEIQKLFKQFNLKNRVNFKTKLW